MLSYISIEEDTDLIYGVDNAKLTKQIVVNKQQEE